MSHAYEYLVCDDKWLPVPLYMNDKVQSVDILPIVSNNHCDKYEEKADNGWQIMGYQVWFSLEHTIIW